MLWGFFMAIKNGVCPCCGKDRELAYFQFGVIKSTMCVYCLQKYLEKAVIPRLAVNNDTSSDNCVICNFGGFDEE
jgi:hypothetical protein